MIDQITVLRIGHSANIELFQYEAPGQRQTQPRNSDWSGHHIAFYVTDIDAAVAYMESRGVEKFFGPFALTAGPAAGQSINYFKTPFGTVHRADQLPERDGLPGAGREAALVAEGERPPTRDVTKVPGLLGIDHIGITVPDVVAAAGWLEDRARRGEPAHVRPLRRPGRRLHARSSSTSIRARSSSRSAWCASATAPGSSCSSTPRPTRTRRSRKNSDWGGHHVAFYVQHIDKAVEYLQAKGAQKRFGPFAVTAGPAAGQSINYFETPFGTDIELISYPHGMAYEATAPIPLWDPRRNRP